jgi:F420 biosynthesis protein FbiB-like protein
MKDGYFEDVLLSRRSIRKFEKREVEDDVVRHLVRMASKAPSAHNSQPARFIVLRSNPARKKLAARMLEKYKSDLISDGVEPDRVSDRIQRSEALLLDSPLILLVCLTMRDMWHYPDDIRESAEYLMAVQSTAAAIENLLLAAFAEGLGACWLCAPLFTKDIVRSQLGLPEDYDPQAFVIMGYPAEIPSSPPRKPVEDIMQVL